jgi:hypothetical protein
MCCVWLNKLLYQYGLHQEYYQRLSEHGRACPARMQLWRLDFGQQSFGMNYSLVSFYFTEQGPWETQSLGCSRILRSLRNIKTYYHHYSLPNGPYRESAEFRLDLYNLFLFRSILILFCHHQLDHQVIFSFVWDISLSVWYTQKDEYFC